jgi:hypothetical protein
MQDGGIFADLEHPHQDDEGECELDGVVVTATPLSCALARALTTPKYETELHVI